ncbi:hypothetical protein Sme01_48080 [Sphaerisporangium melleum]|uniref:Uncharacterized protein n=1 Tax=Sphaerisporangium melleum TaxID=321316 RepID=A0A917R3L8_9ACTN|nr:hypothetical protein GCM10007964_31750 [Sphaerisporangium melleum]GII72332.1 hypothetical protein Sme01_48080 [Sphaerisporangium melleum]
MQAAVVQQGAEGLRGVLPGADRRPAHLDLLHFEELAGSGELCLYLVNPAGTDSHTRILPGVRACLVNSEDTDR